MRSHARGLPVVLQCVPPWNGAAIAQRSTNQLPLVVARRSIRAAPISSPLMALRCSAHEPAAVDSDRPTDGQPYAISRLRLKALRYIAHTPNELTLSLCPEVA
jgi:hypothetical protein